MLRGGKFSSALQVGCQKTYNRRLYKKLYQGRICFFKTGSHTSSVHSNVVEEHATSAPLGEMENVALEIGMKTCQATHKTALRIVQPERRKSRANYRNLFIKF